MPITVWDRAVGGKSHTQVDWCPTEADTGDVTCASSDGKTPFDLWLFGLYPLLTGFTLTCRSALRQGVQHFKVLSVGLRHFELLPCVFHHRSGQWQFHHRSGVLCLPSVIPHGCHVAEPHSCRRC